MSATPRIIIHDIDHVNAMLSVNQYFFSDIYKEGVLLFTSGKHELTEPKELTEKEKKSIARGYFEDQFERAKSFFEYYKFGCEKQDYKGASFMLHQAAEFSFKTILLVFTNYCPDEHYLSRLHRQACRHVPELAEVFVNDFRRFDLLDKAYIGARYMPSTKPFKYPPVYSFDIGKEDLDVLEPEVEKLLELTEKGCKKFFEG